MLRLDVAVDCGHPEHERHEGGEQVLALARRDRNPHLPLDADELPDGERLLYRGDAFWGGRDSGLLGRHPAPCHAGDRCRRELRVVLERLLQLRRALRADLVLLPPPADVQKRVDHAMHVRVRHGDPRAHELVAEPLLLDGAAILLEPEHLCHQRLKYRRRVRVGGGIEQAHRPREAHRTRKHVLVERLRHGAKPLFCLPE
mmetsp:Transcript_18688/g.43520  ORF Transcript_18688/g.43520 Transcript_18688/m.43520 type:complete len:201 (+) Transcript_18688:235-837(+)